MASGDPVVRILSVNPPNASFAYESRILGTSTPAESLRVWTFPDAAAAYLDYLIYLRGYAGGGLTFRLAWSAAAATNNAVWQLAIRRMQDDAEDLDTTSQTYDYNTVTATAPTAIGEHSVDNITFTNGADMDNLANDEFAILRLLRDPAHASDSLANTAYLWGITGWET
jgi:hypothetical protein